MDSEPVIDLSRVSKTYRAGLRARVVALSDVAIRVGRGQVFGLLGPNGAGKSTLVKIIMTVIRPSRGAGTVLGRPIGDRPALARVGYLPENHRFPRYLTGRQTLEFFGTLSGVPRRLRRGRAAELMARVGIADAADRRVGTYSKGMMQRAGLAAALMNDPELLILDEPTDGVDPVGRRDIRQVLADCRARGKTVFINSHLLSELELICDRVAMLQNGRVVAQGSLDELSVAEQRYELEIEPPSPAAAVTPADGRAHLAALLPVTWHPHWHPQQPSANGVASRRLIGQLADGTRVDLDGRLIRAMTAEPARVMCLLDALRAGGIIIRRVHLVRPTLEQLFIATVHPDANNADQLP